MSAPIIKDTPALLRLRQRIENKPVEINNSSLPAGSPMYFYCRMCGHHCDTKGESYTSAPRRHCTECADLRHANPDITDTTILDLAKKAT